MLRFIPFVLVLLYFTPSYCFAKEIGQVTGLPIPRFVTLKSNETNLRKGPNVKYPISWTYKKKGYPMELIAEFENWRKLRDIDGVEGWVHENLITGVRYTVVIDNSYYGDNPIYQKRKRELIVFRYPDESSYPMLRTEFGVLARIKKCKPDWCKVKIHDIVGWVRKENLWGVYTEEVIE